MKTAYREARQKERLIARAEMLAHKLDRMRIHRAIERKFAFRYSDGIPRNEQRERVADLDVYLWQHAAKKVGF